MVREVKRTDLGTEAKKLPWRWKRDGWSVRFICVKPFPLVLYLRLFSDFFLSSASSSPSLPGSCTFSFPVLHMLYAEKWKQRPKRQSLLDYGFSFFSRFSCFFFSFFSSTACLPDLPTTQGWRKETPSFSVFFSPTPCLFYVFSCLSFLIFSSTPPFLLFSFPVQWSLHSNQRMKEKASPPFLRCGLFWEPKQKPVGGGGHSSREGLDLAPFLLSCSPSFLSCFPSFFFVPFFSQ